IRRVHTALLLVEPARPEGCTGVLAVRSHVMITATEVPKRKGRFWGAMVELMFEIMGELPHKAAAKPPRRECSRTLVAFATAGELTPEAQSLPGRRRGELRVRQCSAESRYWSRIAVTAVT